MCFFMMGSVSKLLWLGNNHNAKKRQQCAHVTCKYMKYSVWMQPKQGVVKACSQMWDNSLTMSSVIFLQKMFYFIDENAVNGMQQ